VTCGGLHDAPPPACHVTGHCVRALATALPRLALLDLNAALDLSEDHAYTDGALDMSDERDVVSALVQHCTSLRHLDVTSCGFSTDALDRLARELPSLLHIEAREARILCVSNLLERRRRSLGLGDSGPAERQERETP
jgi:hypothetical protein